MDKTREVLKMLEGSHNFASFAMNKKSRLQTKRSPDQQEKIVTVRDEEFFIRTMDKIEIKQVSPPLSPELCPVYDSFDFYTVEFRAKAYFQNQVRYCCLIYVGSWINTAFSYTPLYILE